MKKFFAFTFFCFISLFISGCSDSPKDVVKKYMIARQNGDRKSMFLYVIPSIGTYQMLVEEKIGYFPPYALEKAKVLKDGPRCIVYSDGYFIIGLGKYDGCWKIDFFSNSLSLAQ